MAEAALLTRYVCLEEMPTLRLVTHMKYMIHDTRDIFNTVVFVVVHVHAGVGWR